MNKKELFDKLQQELNFLSKSDLAKVQDFFSESIDARIEDGMAEEVAIASLGDIDEMKGEIMEEFKSAPIHTASCGVDAKNEKEEHIIIDNTGKSIKIYEKNNQIKIETSLDDKIHIIYPKNKEDTVYEFSNIDDIKLEAKKKSNYKLFKINLFFAPKYSPTIVKLPKTFSSNITLKNTNAIIDISDINISTLIATTSNGRVTIKKIKVNEEIIATTSNGAILLENIISNRKINASSSNGKIEVLGVNTNKFLAKTSNGRIFIENLVSEEEINLKTSNSKISFDKISSSDIIKFKTSNGKIEGTISGDPMEFSIDAETSNGKNNLNSVQRNNCKILKAHTSNGSIKINFEDKQ